jgi:hypothetical protein
LTKSAQARDGSLYLIECARKVFERDCREGLGEPLEDGRLEALDVDLRESGHSEPGDELIQTGDGNLEPLVPSDAGEPAFPRALAAPIVGERGHGRRLFTDDQRSPARPGADGGLEHLDSIGPREQHAQEPGEVRLRLQRDYTTTKCHKSTRAIPCVCPNVEDESARLHKPRVEFPHAVLPQRDSVVDRHGSRQPDGPVESTHGQRTSTVIISL